MDFNSERRIFASRRRRTEPLVGFVMRRGGGGGASASRNSAAKRSRASERLRTCDRWFDVATVRTVPSSRCSRLVRARRRWASVRDATQCHTTCVGPSGELCDYVGCNYGPHFPR